MATRIGFGGQSIRIPGAYSRVNADAMTPTVLGAFSRIGVIGTSTGGVPKTISLYTSGTAAEDDLVSGDLLDAMKLMWAPSPERSGASEILACRVDPATQSSLMLEDTVGEDAIELKSRNYGKFTENIKISITTAADGYGKKLEIYDANKPSERPEQSLNGIGIPFQLTRNNSDAATQYRVEITNVDTASYDVDQFDGAGGPNYYIYLDTSEGNASGKFKVGFTLTTDGATNVGNDQDYTVVASTYDVGSSRTKLEVTPDNPGAFVDEAASPATGATAPLHTMEIYIDAKTEPEVSFDLENSIYDNVYKIVEYINNNYSDLYSVKIRGDNMVSRYLPSADLDSVVSAQNTNVAFSATAWVPLAVNWINTNSNLVEAAIQSAASTYELENIVEQPLSGGGNGTLTTSDWEDAIDLFEAEDIQLMVILTDNLGIQLALRTHIEYMSTQGRSERRGYFGHEVGATIDDVKDRVLALSSNRTMVLTPGIAYDVDDNGDPEIVSSVFAGALACGMVAGSAPQEPLTNKQISILDVEKSYLDSEIIELLDAGAAPIKYDRIRGLFKILQGQTTWLRDDNTLYKEDSVGRIADFISISVRRSLEDRFVGKAAEAGVEEDIRVHVTSMLEEMLGGGLITNYGTVSVRIESTIAYVEYEVAPSEPLNFILITTRFVPSRLVA